MAPMHGHFPQLHIHYLQLSKDDQNLAYAMFRNVRLLRLKIAIDNCSLRHHKLSKTITTLFTQTLKRKPKT